VAVRVPRLADRGRAPPGPFDRRLVEGGRLALDHLQRALRTLAQASTQAVAEDVADEPRLAVDEGDGALGAGGDALAAAVAARLVDLHDLADHSAPLIARAGPCRTGGQTLA